MGIIFNRDNHTALKLAVRITGRRHGVNRDDVQTVVDGIDDDVIKTAVKYSGVAIPVQFAGAPPEIVAAAAGGLPWDGSLIKQFVDWLMSEQGQAFIKFIFSLFGIFLMI